MGIGKKLMMSAHQFVKATDAKGVSLETTKDNESRSKIKWLLGLICWPRNT